MKQHKKTNNIAPTHHRCKALQKGCDTILSSWVLTNTAPITDHNIWDFKISTKTKDFWHKSIASHRGCLVPFL